MNNKEGRIVVHFNRIFIRIKIFYTKFWSITYPLTVVFLFYLISSKVNNCNLFNLCDATFWTAGGIFAILIIAIRQSRIDELSRKSNFFPAVVRYTKSGNFIFELSKGLMLKSKVESDINNVLGVRIKNDNLAYSFRGYVLHQSYFYPLSIVPGYSIDDAIGKIKDGQEKVELKTWNKYTWASKGHDLFFFLDDYNKKGPIKFQGSYYCILFSDNSGEYYFLEEDDGYYLRVKNLKESRPSYFKDFIYWLDLFEKSERQKIENK